MRINYQIFLSMLILNFSAILGYAQKFTLVESVDVASCFDFYIIDEQKNTIDLPQNIKESLKCAVVVDLTENILTFMENKTIKLFDLIDRKEIKLFTLYPDMGGISNPAWSDDRSQVMFVIINQERKYGYTDMARIISLKLDKSMKVESKRKYDRPVHFVCGSTCSSIPYSDFNYTSEGIQYRRNENIEIRPGEFDLLEGHLGIKN